MQSSSIPQTGLTGVFNNSESIIQTSPIEKNVEIMEQVEIKADEPEPANNIIPIIPLKKERKLKLPAAILGAKPGVEPNTKYLKHDLGSGRKVFTSSTAVPKNNNRTIILK
jgi:hypothetical protein